LHRFKCTMLLCALVLAALLGSGGVFASDPPAADAAPAQGQTVPATAAADSQPQSAATPAAPGAVQTPAAQAPKVDVPTPITPAPVVVPSSIVPAILPAPNSAAPAATAVLAAGALAAVAAPAQATATGATATPTGPAAVTAATVAAPAASPATAASTAPAAAGSGQPSATPSPSAATAGSGPSLLNSDSQETRGGLNRLFSRWHLFQGLQISGNNSMTVQRNMLQGSESAFEGQQWDSGSFVRQSSLHLEGPIWNRVGFQADFSASGYGPTTTRTVIGYVSDNTAVYYGDLNIQLGGNEFANFSESLKGWQLDQRLPDHGLFRAFSSKENAFVQNQSFVGNNTSGPYFLSFTPIIDGSEVVKVDEVPQKFGKDYTLDYDTGQLYFQPVGGPTKIIPATSTISVSYQSSGYGQAASTLSGWRLEMPLDDKRLLVGVTKLSHQSAVGGSNDTAGYHQDEYNGSGSTGPFTTTYRPILANGTQVVYSGKSETIDQPLVVLVDGVEQQETVDYTSYRSIGEIIFLHSVPPTSLVIVQYYYSLTNTASSGNQDVTAVDMSYKVSKNLSLRTDFAHSVGGSSGGDGSAFSSSLAYTKPNLNVQLNYHDMQPTFSFIDSVGFQTVEKGTDVTVDWRPTPYLTLHDARSDMRSGSGLAFGYSGYGSSSSTTTTTTTTDTSLDIATAHNNFDIRLSLPKLPSLDFSTDTMSNGATSSAGASTYTTRSLHVQYQPAGKPFSISWQGSTTDQSYAGLAGSGSTGSGTKQTMLNLSFNPGTKLSISASFGNNTSEDTTGQTQSSSQSRQLTLRYTPTERLSFNFTESSTNSTGIVTSGLYDSSLGSTSDTSGTTSYSDDSTRMTVTFHPSQKLTLDYSTGRRLYNSTGSVGYLANSNETTNNLNLTYQVSQAMSLTLGRTIDDTQYLDANAGSMTNNMLTVGLNYKVPKSHWGLGLSYNSQSGTSPTYIGFGSAQVMKIVPTDLTDLEARLSLETGKKSSLSATFGISNYDSGYSAFTKNQTQISWQYRMSDDTNLSFGYSYIRYLNRLSASGMPSDTTVDPASMDYITNTVMLTLSTNFQSGLGGSASSSGGAGVGPGGYGAGSANTFGGYSAGIGGFNGPGAGSSSMSAASGSAFGASGSNGFNTGLPGESITPIGAGLTSQTGTGFYSTGASQAGFKIGLGEFQQQATSSTGTTGPLGMGGMQGPSMPNMAGGIGGPQGPGMLGASADWQDLNDGISLWW